MRVLAENLYQSDLEVFFDEWEIGPGDVLVHKIDQGILTSRSGVLVVSPTSLSRPWVQQEYAAMMTRVVEGKQQNLIPVLLKDAEMPPFLSARVWIDFRAADGPDYTKRVLELVDVLKGGRRGPPPRTGELKPRPDSAFKASGPQALRLSIEPTKTALSGDGVDASGAPPAPSIDSAALKWKLERARNFGGPVRDEAAGVGTQARLETTLAEVGEALAKAFLPKEVAEALAKSIAEAERLNNTLQLGLAIAEPLSALPWETLRLPEVGAIALHPRVALFRQVKTQGPAAAVSIPGPLRILLAIGSPETQNQRGELLDMEAETRRILDATEAAQRSDRAFVRILEEGSLQAIHAALSERRYHILHISCHANEKELLLEDAQGKEDRVTAERLWKEAIPTGKSPALVVLAGCSTGRDAGGKEDTKGKGDESQLPGLARSLAQHGLPSLIAMQATVSDRYATELMSGVYEALSSWDEPQTLAALSYVRRTLEATRLADLSPARPQPEWATPAFFCAATPLSVYDTRAKAEELKQPKESTFDPGVVVRPIGEMVGRRSDQRQLLRALREPNGAGVLIHGIGGVGKSTLVAAILHRLTIDDGFLLFSISGETDPERVLSKIASGLLSVCIAQGAGEKHPLRQLAAIVAEPKHPWRMRFELLAQNLYSQIPVAFLFDNFEDNLKEGAPSQQLGELLSLWLRQPGKSRLLFTSRHPFSLADDAQERLESFPLGPLSWAETRKLFRRLEGIAKLSPTDQRRAYEEVGGQRLDAENLKRLREMLDAAEKTVTAGGPSSAPSKAPEPEQQSPSERGASPTRSWWSRLLGKR